MKDNNLLKKNKKFVTVKSWVLMTLGTLLMSMGVYFFKIPVIVRKNTREYTKYSLRFFTSLTENLTRFKLCDPTGI